jgi:curved DNA-binding protein CbpA
MLPKLFSNIILAVIAILVLYTFAPLIRDILGSLFGSSSNKKRSMSKNDFDEMVRRKAEQMSSTNRQSDHGPASVRSKGTRTEWDYLVEKNYFASKEDQEELENLKKSLEWGSDPQLEKIKVEIEKQLAIEIDSMAFNKVVKETLSKNKILELFPNKDLSIESYKGKLGLELFINTLNSAEDQKYKFYSALSKKLQVSKDALDILLKVSLCKLEDSAIVTQIEAYIDGELSPLQGKSLQLSEYSNIKQIISTLKKNIDLLIPLIPLQEAEIKGKVFDQETDKELLKKKYKKVIAIYHPDRWTYFEKTDSIDKRLRENFNLIQKTYDIMTAK